jgi:hypothetical protein
MVTMADVRRITWSIFWKWSLIALIGGFVAGFVVGATIGFAVGVVQGPDVVRMSPWPQVIQIFSFLFGLVVSFLTLNYLLANAIGKQIGGKKLVLVDALAVGEK